MTNINPYQSKEDANQKKAMTFLGMSGGVMFLAIAVMVILPILICVGTFLLCGFGVAMSPDVYPTITPTW